MFPRDRRRVFHVIDSVHARAVLEAGSEQGMILEMGFPGVKVLELTESWSLHLYTKNQVDQREKFNPLTPKI